MRRQWVAPEAAELAASLGQTDPEQAIQRACEILLTESGANGLPVALSELLRHLGIQKVRQRSMTLEGGLKRTASGQMEVLLRTGRPRRRQRFTLAHEIGHLLFYKYAPAAKARQEAQGGGAPEDEEVLCNLAAAELLIPARLLGAGAIPRAGLPAFILDLSDLCDASMESTLLRVARVDPTPRILEIWARRGEGWERSLKAHSGRLRVSLSGLESLTETDRLLENLSGTGHREYRTLLSSREANATIQARSEVWCSPGGSGAQRALVVHTLQGAQESVKVPGVLRQIGLVEGAARSVKPDSGCSLCRGTGWEELPDRSAVRVCVCRRERARAVLAA